MNKNILKYIHCPWFGLKILVNVTPWHQIGCPLCDYTMFKLMLSKQQLRKCRILMFLCLNKYISIFLRQKKSRTWLSVACWMPKSDCLQRFCHSVTIALMALVWHHTSLLRIFCFTIVKFIQSSTNLINYFTANRIHIHVKGESATSNHACVK